MMPDRSSSSKFNPSSHPRLGGMRRGIGEITNLAHRQNRFLPTSVPAEAFFLETVDALHSGGNDELADAFQRKSIFLDLGILEGLTTFIIWIGCPAMYEMFTDADGGGQISKAASRAAKALGLEDPVRTVIALFGGRTVGEVI